MKYNIINLGDYHGMIEIPELYAKMVPPEGEQRYILRNKSRLLTRSRFFYKKWHKVFLESTENQAVYLVQFLEYMAENMRMLE